MKVLFVNPPCLDRRVTDDDALQVPIGLYYLAAQLLDHGIDAAILNLAPAGVQGVQPGQSAPDPLGMFRAALEKQQPDIIGFSVTNPNRIHAMACARTARQVLPKSLVVFGGPAPTFMTDHLFAACPDLDIVVKGEGELSFSALVKALEAGRGRDFQQSLGTIPGLVFKNGNALTDTGQPPLVQDLDTLVHPAKYFTYQHLAMSRGCPGKCTFCGSPRFWGTARVRRHSPEWFFKEIQALARKGVSHFYISDDTFTMDPRAVADLCERIIDSGLAITWNAISRVDYMDDALLPLMRRAGCIQISFGIESGSPKIKKILGKPIDNETCVRAFDRVKSYGILPRAYFIYGSPGETDATIRESIELMERLGPLSTVFYMLVVFPGTALYTRACNKGWVTEDVWEKEIEDLPWFDLDPDMDFKRVKSWGDLMRKAFFEGLATYVDRIDLNPAPSLAPFHSDFLSRLAMTFSHGEYGQAPRVKDPDKIAAGLFEKALGFSPDPRAFLGLAMIHQKKRRLSRAMAVIDKGLTHFPGHKDLWVCKGVCLMNQGDFHKALNCFSPFDKDPGLTHYIDICKQRISAMSKRTEQT